MDSAINTTKPTKHISKRKRLAHTAQKDVRPFQLFLKKFSNDWSMTFAGALAYSLLTAMLPIAIAIVAILGFILGNILGNPALTQHILSQIQQVLPGLSHQQSSGANTDLLLSVSKQLSKYAGYLVIIAILLALFGGSRLFVAIEGCMSLIYRVRPRVPLQQNLMAIGMLVIFIFLIPIMIFAATLPVAILQFLDSNPGLKTIPILSTLLSNRTIFTLSGYAGGLLAAFILFEAIYMIVPNQKISWKNSWRGALISAVLLEIFIVLFPLYTSKFMNSYVGEIGFAVILLAFFYYFAVILILGAEINAFFFEKVQPLPNDLATFVSTVAGSLNEDHPAGEAKSHVDSSPTEHAGKAKVEEMINEKEQKIGSNPQEQPIAHPGQETASYTPTQTVTNVRPNAGTKTKAIVSVVAGSALTMAIELLRLRKRG